MKKFVSGIIVGALLFAGASAFADSTSLVGKKVTGVFSIEKDGKNVAEAAIINGSAYAPVRAVAQISGATLTVEGKKIIMSDNTANIATSDLPAAVSISRKKIEIQAVQTKIESARGGVSLYETDAIPRAQAAYDNSIGTIEETGRKNFLDNLLANLEAKKVELADLEAQLVELNKQLAELEG
ncbi:hypothetical protein A3844_22795 [Paenibacillus helianthi]|uniref:Copper amine oxidase n=1 Tax=Paenibacillus helianthi TaxID=1349432 RepID=A0ABX3EI37_9BACL|nr:hypothetical protein [Paenibacillus helianthi]OKP83286.1 hypothetical protein A3844_22795 [Paenibacillus helianthi]